MVGKIFLARIFYSDISNSKVRPILVVKENRYSDLIVFPLTTNLEANGLILNNLSLSDKNLPKKSLVVFEKIATISKQFIIKEIATVNAEFFNELRDKFCQSILN